MLIYGHSALVLKLILVLWICENARVRSSHLRGGIIMVRPQPGDNNSMEIFYHISWRRNSGAGGYCSSYDVTNGNILLGEGSLTCQYGCSGTVSSMAYRCTDFSIVENWSFGENQLLYKNFSSIPVLTIGFTGCCWISPFDHSPLTGHWNISSTFSMLPRNDTGVINSTPRAITVPVIRVQEGCSYNLTIPVTDPDNDIIKCRWAIGSECEAICDGIPGAELDEDSCTIKYIANYGTGYKAVALMIEDFTDKSSTALSSVAHQFLVLVFSSSKTCTSSPVFIPPTIDEGTCIAIPPVSTFNTQIIADSLSSDVSISEIETVSPSGMFKGILTQIEKSTTSYYVNISWTPSAEQQNQIYLFCYTAINSDGLSSEQRCIEFYPGVFPPKPIQLTHPSKTTWNIVFDKSIQRPSISAYITFYRVDTDEEVYKIDASLSAEVIFKEPNEILVTPNYSFTNEQEYYIKFERGVAKGLEGCQPVSDPVEDMDFWTFKQDLIPPDIKSHFTLQPAGNNASIFFSWASNESVTWQCELMRDLKEVDVNCSEGAWKGYDLADGEYKLKVEATDDNGNEAVITHSFSVDLIELTTVISKTTQVYEEETTQVTVTSYRACSTTGSFIIPTSMDTVTALPECQNSTMETPTGKNSIELSTTTIFITLTTQVTALPECQNSTVETPTSRHSIELSTTTIFITLTTQATHLPSPVEAKTGRLSSSATAGISIAVTFPVTIIITALLTALAMYLVFRNKRKLVYYKTATNVDTPSGFDMEPIIDEDSCQQNYEDANFDEQKPSFLIQ